MAQKTRNKTTVAILCLVLGFLGTGCGKKAPPVPPGSKAMPAVSALHQSIHGNVLSLTWYFNSGRGEEPAGFYVYRSKVRQDDSHCPGCPVIFQRAAVVPYRETRKDAKAIQPFEYLETLDKGYRYIYKVAVFSKDGLAGKDSNVIEFKY